MVVISLKQSSKIKSKPGFALIAVLLIISLLAAFIIEFNYESRIKLHLADNFNFSAQALNNADAGIAIAIEALRQNEDILDDEKTRPLFSGMAQIQIEEGFCKVSIVEESSKININALCTTDGQPIRQRVDQLLRLIDLINDQYEDRSPVSYSLVPSIIDWVDYDDEVTFLSFIQGQNSGAEEDYYQKLEEPYPCKNAPFEVLSELLLVKGMTNEIFDGQMVDEDTGIKFVPGISQYLTVYGNSRININQASTMVIQSLSENMSLVLAQNIIEQRKFSRYSSIDQLKQVPGMTDEIYKDIYPLITLKTNESYYIVTGTGMVNDFERTVKVVIRKNPLTSQVDILTRFEI